MRVAGAMSTFGGKNDSGVSPSEGLALFEPHEIDIRPEIFLDEQPANTTGMARRLDEQSFYLAARWDYSLTPRDQLQRTPALVRNPESGKIALAWPCDWGPNEAETGRALDLSPGLAEFLNLATDDLAEMQWPAWQPDMEWKPEDIKRFAISAGHSLYVRGASDPDGLDEVNEARAICLALADALHVRNVICPVYFDDVSQTQNENLNRICDWHNSQARELDISVHLNAGGGTGTEVLYVTQEQLAGEVSAAIAGAAGWPDRGAKYRGDLFFLNNTDKPAILLEVCFVEQPDAATYQQNFDAIIEAMASALAGEPRDQAPEVVIEVKKPKHIKVSFLMREG